MNGFLLDAEARLALDVASGTAGAMGDEQTGTEYLLFGIVATARDEMAELAELFALNTLRVERGVKLLRSHRCCEDRDRSDDPPLSTRAEIALYSHALSGAERLSAFDLLVAVLADPRSGAATVLRNLGVRIGEIRRLAELGAARLERHEVEDLIAALDRRGDNSNAWWGPSVDGPVARVALPHSRPMVLGRSETAVATLDGLVTGPDGFGLTITITSCDHWVLPPRWEPEEDLVPGIGAVHRSAPDVVTIDLRYGDERVVSNRLPSARWRADVPTPGALVRLGTRSIVDERNDRRIAARRAETSEWWAWPLPTSGSLSLGFEWPAEALGGVAELSADEINAGAAALRLRR